MIEEYFDQMIYFKENSSFICSFIWRKNILPPFIRIDVTIHVNATRQR